MANELLLIISIHTSLGRGGEGGVEGGLIKKGLIREGGLIYHK